MKHLNHEKFHALQRRDFTVIDGTTYQVTYQTQSATFSNVIGYTTAQASTTSAAASTGRIRSSASASPANSTPSTSTDDSSAQSTTVALVSQSTQGSTQVTSSASLQVSQAPTTGTPFSTNAGYSAAPSNTSSSDPSAVAGSSNNSSGAKIGIVVGLIVVIAAILGLCLFCLSKKKKQVKAEQARADAEKNAAIDALRETKTQVAPRLSLRPASSFLPEFLGVKRKSRLSAGNLLAPTAETNATREMYLNGGAAPQAIQMSEKQPMQENPFRDPENPFADP
ncbi:hypothetical protein LTR66_017664, partial [Elasticomyces elasticus]